jgi:flagellar secretion chaperone FliS
MTPMTTELSYRKSAIAGASPIGLLVVLLDTLVGDFRRAASSIRKDDIELRCRELNHAALVLGQLEDWIDLKSGGESAQTLSRFYAYLRSKMMEAAGSKSAKLLEAQIDMILHVRSAWQQLDALPPQVSETKVEVSVEKTSARYPTTFEMEPARERFSQSA